MPFPHEFKNVKKWTLPRGPREGKKPFPPCRTLSEFAEMLGVSTQSLQMYMLHSPSAPKAQIHSGRIGHYQIPDMVKWWKTEILPKREVSKS